MVHEDPPARLPEIEQDELDDEARAFLAKWAVGAFKDADRNPVLRTFAHHPKLADLFSQLNIHLLTTSTLPVKQRQIAIMRTAWLCGSRYMWSSHLNTSLLFGLDEAMFAPVRHGPDDPYFTPFEREIVLATDEMVRDRTLSDATWAALAAEWDERQMLDFLFTVGTYVAIAGVMRATGVRRQPDLLALAERHGAPA
jgi:alkylhydroperoxidase family enzyme